MRFPSWVNEAWINLVYSVDIILLLLYWTLNLYFPGLFANKNTVKRPSSGPWVISYFNEFVSCLNELLFKLNNKQN